MMPTRRPRILLTSWLRKFDTYLGPETRLETISPFYARGVRRAGGLPLIAPHPEPDEIAEFLEGIDGVVMAGGYDIDPALYGAENTESVDVDRHDDESDISLLLAAIEAEIPVLAICRGIEICNVAMGGDIAQEVQSVGSDHHPMYSEMRDPLSHRHPVEIVAGTRLAGIYGAGTRSVNSLHHQAIGRLSNQLEAVAVSPDGVIEAVEGKGMDLLAVQWHPEFLDPDDGGLIFSEFVERTRRRMVLTAGG